MSTEAQTDPNAKGVDIMAETDPDRQTILVGVMVREIYDVLKRYGLSEPAGVKIVMLAMMRDFTRWLATNPETMDEMHNEANNGLVLLFHLNQTFLHEMIDAVHNRTGATVNERGAASNGAAETSSRGP